MIETADIAVLVVVALVLMVLGLRTYLFLRRDGFAVQKYRLYGVRDEFIHLVADGKLTEDEFLFQRFYMLTNYLINTTKEHLCLESFVAALTKLGEQGRDPADHEELRRISEALKHKDWEVSKAVTSFYTAVLVILLENSLVLRGIYGSKPMALVLRGVYRLLPAIAKADLRPQPSAYKIYSHYQQAAQELQAA